MKTMQSKKIMSMLLMGALAVIVPTWAMASTAPCTLISNTATANYSVGGVGQPSVTSSAASFNVGVKVIVSVTNNDGNEVTVVPGTGKYALKFTVANTGNAVQDYTLSSEAASNGTASPYGGANDSFDGTTIQIYVEDGTNAGFQAGEDTLTSTINDLAADSGTKVAYIVYSPTDLSESNLETAVYYLKTTSKWADGSAISLGSGTPTAAQAGGSCDGATTVDVVAGDDDGDATGDDNRDGEDSDDGAFEVCSPIIGVSKTKSVIWDPINYNSTAKAIPGAIIEYTVQIANTGASQCPAVLSTITDDLQTANLGLVSAFKDGDLGTATPTSSSSEAFIVSCSAGCGIRACESGGYTFTSANDADGIEFVSPTFTATMGTVLPSEDTGACAAGSLGGPTDTVTIKFQATIN